ncbi:GAP family protein [Halomarina salina]|uniref:GAP family protein n=1 Tax=Halomarina salina TaxID=1872699 RepID=A0ABD5RMW1_9EURY|nr:GAP family protein [Halomarina salina]
MSFATILPLAIVMVAGPQLLSAVFLATSERWRRNSFAYVLGAALSISAIVAIAYYLGGTGARETNSRPLLPYVVVALLLAAMVHTYLTREESEPPKWMGTLTSASPWFSFRLGFLLLGFFPTDILTAVAVGTTLASEDLPLLDAWGFVALTLLFIALPGLAVLALGERAERALPTIRDWMNDNAWVINEVVLAFFVVLTLT